MFHYKRDLYDEGKTYTGKVEIWCWMKNTNDRYRSVMKPLHYEESGSNSVLTAEVSSEFTGSPIVLQFHLGIKDGFNDSLKVIQ